MKRPPDPFWRVALFLGGDALGTAPINGHYYVSSHGRLTEVSRAVWIYSWPHSFFTVTTFPLVFIVGFVHELLHGPGIDSRERGIRWSWRLL